MLKVEFIIPTEENNYILFNKEYEDDPTVAFHCTPIGNFDLIYKNGFKSASKLKKDSSALKSISFAKKSSQCLAYMGMPIKEDFCVFVVQFAPEQSDLVIDDLYIYMNDNSAQPKILSYCDVKKGIMY